MRYNRTCKQLYHWFLGAEKKKKKKKRSDRIYFDIRGESNETKRKKHVKLDTYSTPHACRSFEESSRTKWTIIPSAVYSRRETRDLWDRRNCAARNVERRKKCETILARWLCLFRETLATERLRVPRLSAVC